MCWRSSAWLRIKRVPGGGKDRMAGVVFVVWLARRRMFLGGCFVPSYWSRLASGK